MRPAYLADEPVAVSDAAYPSPAGDGSGSGPLGGTLLELLAAPNIASKRWAFEQYDYIVQANTVQVPGSDAAVLRIKDTRRGIAFVNDCNGRHCYLDPYRGGKAAVAEAARNLSCVGALPVAVTDCLNFGNPEKGEMYYTFEQAVEGMAEACEVLETPVVSGNVSFYNESFGKAIYPTPMVGMLGVFDDVSLHQDSRFKDAGDVVLLLGPADSAFVDGSEYQKRVFGRVEGRIPDVDLALEKALQAVVREGIQKRLVKSAHDCAEGGLAVALAECCIASGTEGGALTAAPPPFVGAALSLETSLRPDIALFGEGPSRVVVSCSAADRDALLALAGAAALPAQVLGTVAGSSLSVTLNGVIAFDLPVTELHRAYESLPERLA